MPELKIEQLYLIAWFVLPGAISMFMYGLRYPQKEFRLQEKIVEAICFSLVNFILVGYPLFLFVGLSVTSVYFWLCSLVAMLFTPVLWVLLFIWIMRIIERRGWILPRAKTAWDDFFAVKRECWIQVEMSDGRLIGGIFSGKSFASSYPDPGHLYIEELWTVDAEGIFVKPWPGGAGVLLRPTDYKLIRVYTGAVT